MASKMFRYLFRNTSQGIVMTGCTWEKDVQEQVRYAYSCEVTDSIWETAVRYGKNQNAFCSDKPLDLFVMGAFTIEDIARLISAIHHGGVRTAVIPYVSPIQRLVVIRELNRSRLNLPEVMDFIQDPYKYLEKSSVGKFYIVCGNGSDLQRLDENVYPGCHFENQSREVLEMVAKMEGYPVPIVKAGYIVEGQMLFYLGCYGLELSDITEFVYSYSQSDGGAGSEDYMTRMLKAFLSEFGNSSVQTVTMFCGPLQTSVAETDCVFNTIVIDPDDKCHADIMEDEGRCSMKCFLYKDYDTCKNHRCADSICLRIGVLLLGNICLRNHFTVFNRRYHIINEQIRALTLPNGGNPENWSSRLVQRQDKKNVLFWICPVQQDSRMSEQVLWEIKMQNARNRIIHLNEDYGFCMNGYLTDKRV